ncbi:MAG TPA: ATP-binding protein [Candidatus Kapabacteria bacterium]|nr:ATP-binding protein [Candidatus Kapabacteria bacterium]
MEDKVNNTLSKSAELLKYVASLFTIAAGLFGAVKDIWGLRAYAIIPALLGIGWFGFLIYQAVKRAKQKRRSIRFREEDRPTGFNEALAYTTRDVHRFYGRQNDTFNIINRIDRDAYRLGVLHGDCGVGKTSIIQAGLIPELENRKLQWGYVSLNLLPKTIDSADDLVEFLLRQVGKKFDLSGAANLKDMAKQLAAKSKTGTIFFLDQFEQIFDRTNEATRQEFAQRLEDCCRSIELLKIAIVVRGDYFGRVFKMFQGVERNAISDLAKFNKVQAREVIRKSAGYDENLNITSPDDPLLGFEDDILADLQDSDGRVHPVELSLICSTIIKQNGKLDRGAYLDGGRKQGWLNRYLDDVLKGRPQQTSLQLLSGLIDADKVATLTAKEISERSGINLLETRGLLDYFQQSRLIVEEGENDEQKYRLAHEYLIASIRLKCGDVENPVQKYNRLLETRVQAWEREDHNPLHLLRGKSLYKVRFQLREHLGWDIAPVKKAFVRKSLTEYLTLMLLYAMLVGAIGYGGYTIKEGLKVTKYLTVLQYKSVFDLIKELSTEDSDVRVKVLKGVLSDTKRCYKNEIINMLFYSLIGIPKDNQDKVVEFLIDILENNTNSNFWNRAAEVLGKIGPPAKPALSVLNRLNEKEKNYEKKYYFVQAMLKIDPTNRKYLIILIEEILPHPFAVKIKPDILKSVGEVAGKEAAGKNLDFDGDMRKMLVWWEQYKKMPLRP